MDSIQALRLGLTGTMSLISILLYAVALEKSAQDNTDFNIFPPPKAVMPATCSP